MKFISVLFLLLLTANINAATYYVKNGGDDSLAGTSNATAWETIGKINSSVSGSEDKVYLLCNDSFALTRLYIDWAGTVSNQAVVGAYYMNGGTETVVTSGCPSGESKPEISGGYINSTTLGTVPSGFWDGLVQITTDYVTVENLRVVDSSGYGIVAKSADYSIIQENEIEHISGSGIGLDRNVNEAQIINNTITRAAWSNVDGINPWSTHPSCISIARANHVNIEGNTIIEGYCEGINIWDNSNYVAARRNTIIGVKYIGGYVDNATNVVYEMNLVQGYGDGTLPRTGIAFASSVEGFYSTIISNDNIVFRNNLIANVNTCFYANVEAAARTASKVSQFQFLDNTCVGSDDAVWLENADSNYAAGSEIANNIFWETANAAAGCKSPTGSNITFLDNHLDTTFTDTDCAGTGDQAGTPTLNTTSTFLNYTSTYMPTVVDFGLDTGSTARTTGTVKSSTVFTFSAWNIEDQLTDHATCPLSATEAEFDYACVARDGTNPDKGALEVGSEGTPSSTITVPYYENIGTTGQLALSKTYLTEDATYRTDTGGTSYTSTTATAISGTTDDAVYQAWRGCNCTMQWSYPIANGDYDLTLLFTEQYNGDEGNICGDRKFDISIEGMLEENEYNLCPTGVANTALRYVKPSITVSDGVLTFTLTTGTTSSVDNKPELMGVEITTAAPTGSTLTIGDSTPSITITNNYPGVASINPAVEAIASSTALTPTVVSGSLVTTGLTCGSAALSTDNSLIEFTFDDANENTNGCGDIELTLSDGEDTAAITITISNIQRTQRIKFTVPTEEGAKPSTSNWSIIVFDIDPYTGGWDASTPICREETDNNSLDASGQYTFVSSCLPEPGTAQNPTTVYAIVFNWNLTVNGKPRVLASTPVEVTR